MHHSEVIIDAMKRHGIEPVRGAEIGVQTGKTSAALLAAFPRLTLLMVDPWRAPGADESFTASGDPTARQADADFERAMQDAIRRTSFARHRTDIHRQTSQEAVQCVADGSLDFAFIDGDHSFDGVLRDARLWCPKVRVGGLLFFHDYGSTASWCSGVKPAVDEFAESAGYVVSTGDKTVAWIAK